MAVINRHTGALITDRITALKQNIIDILTTHIGERGLVGAYGGLLHSLVDAPGSAATLQRFKAATIDAIKKWEPDAKDLLVTVRFSDNRFSFSISGTAFGEAFAIGEVIL